MVDGPCLEGKAHLMKNIYFGNKICFGILGILLFMGTVTIPAQNRPAGGIYSAAFSPDGKIIAAAKLQK
jgi:hypothetical protein